MKKRMAVLLTLGVLLGASGSAWAEDGARLEVESKLSGSAYTYGKSTLKQHTNGGVDYAEDSQAVFTLTLPDGSAVDDSKIDTSGAKVELVEGEGYYPDEYVFTAAALDGEWSGGTYIYTLQKGALELNREVYPLKDTDSGREWSCLGGDGEGSYQFNLKVSGVVYDGQELEAQTFPVNIKIYGFDYTGDASALYGEEGTQAIQPVFASLGGAEESVDEPVWTWKGEGELPLLCDQKEDDFYVTWPEGTDASELTSAEVAVALHGTAGEELVLVPDQDYYVSSDEGETQIALTYVNWPFIPVYSAMTIEVNGAGAEASKDFEIASVYVYEAQQGGGGTTVDGTVTAYSFYGLSNLESWEQILSAPHYFLVQQEGDAMRYYAEDGEGNGYLTENAEEAMAFDAAEERNPRLIGNTVYITTRVGEAPVEKTIDGQAVELTKWYPGWDSPLAAQGGGSLLSPSACDQTLEAAPGYAIPWGTENWITNEKWAWQKGVDEGWTGLTITPSEGKSEWKVEKGAQQQFTAQLGGETEHVTWSIHGDVNENTTVSEDGTVTIAENEEMPQFAVTAEDEAGNLGTVTIKVQ